MPTDDLLADRKRGKHFAELTLAAMMDDPAVARPLEKIFESIIDDALRRRVKGGKGST